MIGNLFRSGWALSRWLSLAAPFVLFVSLMTLGTLFPSLFCVAVNSGGKETICGSEYSHPGINLFRLSGLFVWVLLVATGGTEVFRRLATRSAVIAWAVSVLLLVSWAMLWLTRPVECTP